MTTTAGPAAPYDVVRAALDESPNRPELLAPVRELLRADPSPRARAVLFDWYLRDGLAPAIRAELVGLIAEALAADSADLAPNDFAIEPAGAAFEALYVSPIHWLTAWPRRVRLMHALQRGNATAATAPKFIVAPMKSGSSLLGSALGLMVTADRGDLPTDPVASGARGYPTWHALPGAFDWDLRPEIGAEPFLQQEPAGVYKGHVEATPGNLAVLDLYAASRVLIVLRDPRDLVVANAAGRLRAEVTRGRIAADPESRFDERLEGALTGGMLFDLLRYMARWLECFDPARMTVVTYRELIAAPTATLRRVADFYELSVDDATITEIYHRCERGNNRETSAAHGYIGADRRAYPFGWTGRPDVWQAYFTPEHAATYDAVVAGARTALAPIDLVFERFPGADRADTAQLTRA